MSLVERQPARSLSISRRSISEIAMLKIIMPSSRQIMPFNERARDLRIQNKPLWLAQRDELAPYTTHELELKPGGPFPQIHEPCLVYRDNLYFDSDYIAAFLAEARTRNCASA